MHHFHAVDTLHTMIETPAKRRIFIHEWTSGVQTGHRAQWTLLALGIGALVAMSFLVVPDSGTNSAAHDYDSVTQTVQTDAHDYD
jgi:hypothetical protein